MSKTVTAQIDIPHERIADFCQRYNIRRMALFGSVIRDDFTPESDVDVLVEFAPGPSPTSTSPSTNGKTPP